MIPPPTDLVAAYHQARALDDAGQLVEAADLFEAIVRADPQHEVAQYAVDLSLDALNRAGRAACVARIGALAVDYRSLLGCEAGSAPSEEICARLDRLRCQVIRAEAESLAERGDDARASQAFESTYLTHCATRSDEALYNAALLARRAGDSARADMLVAELRRAYPDSPVLRMSPPP